LLFGPPQMAAQIAITVYEPMKALKVAKKENASEVFKVNPCSILEPGASLV
jgi:hypothetical protein